MLGKIDMKASFWTGLALLGVVTLLVSNDHAQLDGAVGGPTSAGIEPVHGQTAHVRPVLVSAFSQALAGPFGAGSAKANHKLNAGPARFEIPANAWKRRLFLPILATRCVALRGGCD